MNRSQSTPGLVEPHAADHSLAALVEDDGDPHPYIPHMPPRMPSLPTGILSFPYLNTTNPTAPGAAGEVTPPLLPPTTIPRIEKPKEVLTLPLSSSRAGAGPGYHSPQPHSMYNANGASTLNGSNHIGLLTVPIDSHRRSVGGSGTSNNGGSRSTTPGTVNADETGGGGGMMTSEADFMAEIRRLRERLALLETENSTLNTKLSQQQWDVENRLAEIEQHIQCGSDSPTESDFSELTLSNLPPLEKPSRESIIWAQFIFSQGVEDDFFWWWYLGRGLFYTLLIWRENGIEFTVTLDSVEFWIDQFNGMPISTLVKWHAYSYVGQWHAYFYVGQWHAHFYVGQWHACSYVGQMALGRMLVFFIHGVFCSTMKTRQVKKKHWPKRMTKGVVDGLYNMEYWSI